MVVRKGRRGIDVDSDPNAMPSQLIERRTGIAPRSQPPCRRPDIAAWVMSRWANAAWMPVAPFVGIGQRRAPDRLAPNRVSMRGPRGRSRCRAGFPGRSAGRRPWTGIARRGKRARGSPADHHGRDPRPMVSEVHELSETGSCRAVHEHRSRRNSEKCSIQLYKDDTRAFSLRNPATQSWLSMSSDRFNRTAVVSPMSPNRCYLCLQSIHDRGGSGATGREAEKFPWNLNPQKSSGLKLKPNPDVSGNRM